MTKYAVDISFSRPDWETYVVDADNEEKAKEAALDQATDEFHILGADDYEVEEVRLVQENE